MPAVTLLFVDDEAMVVDGMRRMLRTARSEWTLLFATSAAQALDLMATHAVDVIVTDMRMPGMDGRQLLEAVRSRYPKVARLMLSGQAEQQVLMKAVGCVHQFLAKPCDAAVLRSTIARTLALRQLLKEEGEALTLAGIDSLPALPANYQELVRCMSSPDASLDEAAAIIARDPALTSLVLKVANSAFFGAPRPVTTVARACTFLGLEILGGLALSQSLMSADPTLFETGAPLDGWQQHSVQIGALARDIGAVQKLARACVDQAFLAGLLHDIGHLVLATHAAGRERTWLQAQHPHGPPEERTSRHALTGAYVLGLWGFPDSIVEAVAWHHDLARLASGEFGLPQVVHLAEQIARHPGASSPQSLELDAAFTAREDFGLRWERLTTMLEKPPAQVS